MRDGIDDAEVGFKIRSARQLLAGVQHRHDGFDEVIDNAVDDDELVANLRDIGYVE